MLKWFAKYTLASVYKPEQPAKEKSVWETLACHVIQ